MTLVVTAEHRRRRSLRATALLITIVVGLVSRRVPTPLPSAFQKESGDVLWATAAYFAIAIVFTKWPPVRIAVVATALAMLTEISQRNHAVWSAMLRTYALGHLLLGSGFSWLDMAMYPVGTALAWAIDWVLFRTMPNQTTSPPPSRSRCRRAGRCPCSVPWRKPAPTRDGLSG